MISGDQHGRAQAITVITTVKPLRRLGTALLFAVTRLVPATMGIRELGSVYFTRWSILRAFPWNGPPQVRERVRRPQLIWETTYSGATEPYIEAFVTTIRTQISRTWATSFGFPGATSVTDLKRYIGAVSLPGSYFWSAYPEATVRMAGSALAVAREHPFLLEAARTADPEEFAVVYAGFLVRRQGDL